MATRSTISVVNPTTGEIKSVYCHWDGYPEHNGRILMSHYATLEQAMQLVEMGSISSLHETIQDSVFYHRDRGEYWDDAKPNVYPSMDNFMVAHYGQEFDYVYRNEQWHLFEPCLVPMSM